MKGLQIIWGQSSVQIAEAQEEVQSYKAELEELQERRKIIEKELSDLEATIDEDQRARASSLRAGLREAASIFADRSRFYAALESGDLFDATRIQGDKEAITLYGKVQTEVMKRLLQQPYEQALRNQEERQRASSLEPIDAGVVLHQKGEKKLDIYVTALTNSTGGLANNLTKAVHAAVQASGVSYADNNVEDILRITVEGDYQGLVKDLRELQPLGFKEASVGYHVLVLGGEKAAKKNEEREKRARTALQLEEVIHVDKIPEGYMILDEAAALLDIDRTHCYPFLKSGELASKKYRTPDKTKPVRAVEIESLRELCKKRGKNFPEEITDTYSPSTDAPVLESIVADLPEESAVSTELTEEPQPKSLASRILGEQISAQYSSSYGSEEVEKVVTQVISCLGEERAKKLFAADVKKLVLKEQNRGRYLGRLNVLLSEVDRKYGAEVPSECSFEAKPGNFLPNSLSAIERKLEEAPIPSQPSISNEMALKMDVDPTLASKLSKDGYNPVYVHAMLKGGFGLGSGKQYVGEAYFPREYWRGRTKRALNSLGVKSMDETEFSRHERIFRQLKLFNEKTKQEHPLAFSPKWSDNTSGALKDYLASIFYPKK